MSKKNLIGLYFVAACVLGVCIQFSDPLALVGKKYHEIVSASVGTGIAIFLMAAIVPSIIWLIGLFRPRANRASYNRAALVLWPVFGLVFGLMMMMYVSEQKIEAELFLWIVPLGLASYVAFYPYTDTLKQKIALNMTPFPGLMALLVPMLRNEGPQMVPIYFTAFVVSFAITTALFHFAERGLRGTLLWPVQLR
jgi:hypothetical protein